MVVFFTPSDEEFPRIKNGSVLVNKTLLRDNHVVTAIVLRVYGRSWSHGGARKRNMR